MGSENWPKRNELRPARCTKAPSTLVADASGVHTQLASSRLEDDGPQEYAPRVRDRPPAAWYSRLDGIRSSIISLGLAPRDAVILEVPRRQSGKIRKTPILPTEWNGDDYLVARAGGTTTGGPAARVPSVPTNLRDPRLPRSRSEAEWR
jgi:hypothetical protein